MAITERVFHLDSSFTKLKARKVWDQKRDDHVDITHCQLPEPFIEVNHMKKYLTITNLLRQSNWGSSIISFEHL